MKNRNSIIITCLFLSIVFLTTGTFAYFRRGATGNVNVNTGKLTLSINDKSAYKSETFEVVLTNADGSNLKPGDSGSFNLELDASGSSFDVSVNLELSRTDLPDNLKFYLDSEHTKLFTKRKYDIEKSSSMVENVTIYWYWEDLEESNDNDFMFKEIKATISGMVSYFRQSSLYETLTLKDYTLDTGVDFRFASSSTNGQGLMMRSGTENAAYPILYYRGDVIDNNVIFAGFCWLIVRTTETGGVKIVYNGLVNDDGSCNNYSGVSGATVSSDGNLASTTFMSIGQGKMTLLAPPSGSEVLNSFDACINQSGYAFNTNYKSPLYAGYMYNNTDLYVENSVLDVSGYKNHLNDNDIDTGTGRHVQNLKDSNAKLVIDEWYASKIDGTSEEALLEDTVWCNDRSVTSTTYTLENYVTNSNSFYYSAHTRLHENNAATPSLSCGREVDRFTVSRDNGNGDLTYPIGLLTADEVVLSGTTSISYLRLSSGHYWTMSPNFYKYEGSARISVFSVGDGLATDVYIQSTSRGLRPSVSLGREAYVTGGNGTFETPYLVG